MILVDIIAVYSIGSLLITAVMVFIQFGKNHDYTHTMGEIDAEESDQCAAAYRQQAHMANAIRRRNHPNTVRQASYMNELMSYE